MNTMSIARTESVKAWADRALAASSIAVTPGPQLRPHYVAWCEVHGMIPLPPGAFGRAMAKLYKRTRRGPGAFYNCTLRHHAFPASVTTLAKPAAKPAPGSVTAWSSDALVTSDVSHIPGFELRAVYEEWCAKMAVPPLSPEGFGRAMAKLYKRTRTSARAFYYCAFKHP